MKCYVYALVDPRDGLMRYVGATRKEPLKRLMQHWLQPTNQRMADWFAELRRESLRPSLRILEETTATALRLREDYWIAALITHKTPLLNAMSPIERSVLDCQPPWVLPQ